MNAAIALSLTFVVWLAVSIVPVSIPWMLGAIFASIVFRYFAVKKRHLFVSRDPLLLVALFPSIALALYAVMFSIIDVDSYLESAYEERYTAMAIGSHMIMAMLFGGALHLFFCRRAVATNNSGPISRIDFRLTLIFAWLPLVLVVACYFLFFYGRPYVEIHSNVPIAANISIKTIYFSYAATFLIARAGFIPEVKRRRHILMLLGGHFFVFAILFKLRSPAIFFMFLALFYVGYKIPKKIIIIGAISSPVILAAIALVRDPSLLEGGVEMSVVKLIVTFGDFVDALRFAVGYVNTHGPLFGGGIVGSFFGTAEPLANIYARSISEDYFDSGGGFGFFILADIFVNFGFIFGVLFSVVLGYSVSKLSIARFGTTSSYLASILFASALALTRNDLGSTLRGVIYCIPAFVVVTALTRRKVA